MRLKSLKAPNILKIRDFCLIASKGFPKAEIPKLF